jgi:hypothetical protein
LTIFQQNRERWQKREDTPENTTTPTTTYQPQSAILTRPRLQPDLVMDLPPPSQQDNTTPPLSSGSTSASSSMTSLDKQTCDDAEEDNETLGDHFAKQNQSTLKKNEKYQDLNVKRAEKNNSENRVSAKIEEIVLRIEEANEKPDTNRLSTGSIRDRDKSPIPSRNTQKFVSQFADLKLTGGCSATSKSTSSLAKEPEKVVEKEKANFIFGSFKPPISIKPQILQKKKSIFLQAHSSSSPSTSPDPSADTDHN